MVLQRRSALSRRRKRQRGAGIIEFALLSFTLVMLMLAGIEVDRLILVYTSLAGAAVEGVRYASVQATANVSGVQDTVKNYATGINRSNMTVDVTYSNSGAPASMVTVTASYTYDPWLARVFPTGMILKATSKGVITY
jgi:Flp pilus assembly protein TadG